MPEHKHPSHSLHVLGWKEWLALPDLDAPRVRAKIDSGAKTSALHAENITEFKRDGKTWLRFGMRLPWPGPHTLDDISNSNDDDENAEIVVPPLHYAEAPLLEYREVTSSNGSTESRPVITTDLALFGKRWPIEITLTRRSNMRFPMLLGREAMAGRAVVDVSRTFTATKPTKIKKLKQNVN